MPRRIPIPAKEIIENLRNNHTMIDAANSLKVSYDTYKKWYYHYFPAASLTEEEIEALKTKVLDALKSNYTVEATAQVLGVSSNVLKRLLNKLNIEVPKFYNLSDAARILGLSRMAMSVKWRKGELPGAFKKGRSVIVPESVMTNLKSLYEPYSVGIHYGKEEIRYAFKGQQ